MLWCCLKAQFIGHAVFNIYIYFFYMLIANKGLDIIGFADDRQMYSSFATFFEHHYNKI